MRNDKILRLNGISKSFGGLKALKYCSIDIEKGTITGLVGPNGAGKTTLFNTITGFFKPDAGEIFFKDEKIDGLSPAKVFKKKIVRTFQIPRMLRLMTVLDNIMIVPSGQIGERIWGPWLRPIFVRKQEKQIEEKALAILEFLNIAHLKENCAGNLSGGQKKLLELGRALMADPEMILLDEPAAGVNPNLIKELMRYIERLRENGITFLLIEHNMNLVMKLCNPIIVMNNGGIIAYDTPEKIRNDKSVIEAYLG